MLKPVLPKTLKISLLSVDRGDLGSGLIAQSQKATAAAMQIAEK